MGSRERYRAHVRAEIKAHAWEQVAVAGAAALSLNAIARRMGVSGPALYRYFGSRDALITDLVLDAYRDLAAACHAAVRPDDPPAARLAALAAALRGWALAAPHRYLLIFGTPVPGYAAPPETTALAASVMAPVLDAFTEAGPQAGPACAAVVALDRHLGGHGPGVAARRRALTFWTRLHGVVSLEVAGHFTGMGFDTALLYSAESAAATAAP